MSRVIRNAERQKKCGQLRGFSKRRLGLNSSFPLFSCWRNGETIVCGILRGKQDRFRHLVPPPPKKKKKREREKKKTALSILGAAFVSFPFLGVGRKRRCNNGTDHFFPLEIALKPFFALKKNQPREAAAVVLESQGKCGKLQRGPRAVCGGGWDFFSLSECRRIHFSRGENPTNLRTRTRRKTKTFWTTYDS